ncbi:Trihydroxynaphthalene reductase [Polyrhizophydium stewartii]|uniref:Homoserine kinase n=1 Tax=Polyrhizophydium stewartii TaxID=2732419 RepID=A0ABR4MZX3_9FUNG
MQLDTESEQAAGAVHSTGTARAVRIGEGCLGPRAAADAARVVVVRAPGSSANVGPGFDTLGLAVALHLEVTALVPAGAAAQAASRTAADFGADFGADFDIEVADERGTARGAEAARNLVVVAAARAAAAGTALPRGLRLRVRSAVPRGRGLGSSGAAAVAGAALAAAACALPLSRAAAAAAAAALEGHADNAAASALGGFIAAAMPDADGPDRHDGRGRHALPAITAAPLRLPPAVRIVAAVPRFELATHVARAALPTAYARADAVFNVQRIALLIAALAQDSPDPASVASAMRDRLHQPHRAHLVPGLADVLALDPANVPGLLGVCLSGAGPTAVALATHNFDDIGTRMVAAFRAAKGPDGLPVEADYLVLDVDREGVVVDELPPECF